MQEQLRWIGERLKINHIRRDLSIVLPGKCQFRDLSAADSCVWLGVMNKAFSTLLAVLSLSLTPLSAGLVTKEITYKSGDTELKGYLAWNDSTKEKRPGVLVVHEWWGHNDYARKRAEMLAELGYVGMAIDMYGDGKKAHHPKDAGAFAAEALSNLEVAEARFKAAMRVLQREQLTDSRKIAAIGYCFGGSVVLHAARVGMDLDGVVSFHGSLGAKKEAQPGMVKARALVCNGASDPMVKQEAIDAFKMEMEAAGVAYEFINYEGALHGFTNPGATENGKKFDLPLAYDAEADADSWERMQTFFEEIFEK